MLFRQPPLHLACCSLLLSSLPAATHRQSLTKAPAAPPSKPTLKIIGSKTVTTTKSTAIVRGTATDASQILYIVGKKGSYKLAKGTTAWSFKAKLLKGKNTISIYAKGPGGSTVASKITIVRK